MADEQSILGGVGQGEVAGATEKMAGLGLILKEVAQGLDLILRNPAASGYFYSQLATKIDDYIIKRFKETLTLTKDLEIQLDKVTQAWRKQEQQTLRIAGAIGGLGMGLANLADKYEKAAVGAARFINLSQMPGGSYNEAIRRQQTMSDRQIEFSKEFAQDFSQNRDRLQMLMKQSGMGAGLTPDEATKRMENVVDNITAISQLSGGNVAGFAATMQQRYLGQAGIDVGKAQQMAQTLFKLWNEGSIGGENFNEVLENTASSFDELIKSGKNANEAWRGALGLQALSGRGTGMGTAEVRRLQQFTGGMGRFAPAEVQNLYAAAERAGVNVGGFEQFQQTMARGTPLQRIGMAQRIVRQMGIMPGQDLTRLPMQQRALIERLFGSDMDLVQILSSAKEAGREWEKVGDLAKISGKDAQRSAAENLGAMAKTLKDSGTLFETLSAGWDKFKGTVTKWAGPEVSKGLGYALGSLPMLLTLGRLASGKGGLGAYALGALGTDVLKQMTSTTQDGQRVFVTNAEEIGGGLGSTVTTLLAGKALGGGGGALGGLAAGGLAAGATMATLTAPLGILAEEGLEFAKNPASRASTLANWAPAVQSVLGDTRVDIGSYREKQLADVVSRYYQGEMANVPSGLRRQVGESLAGKTGATAFGDLLVAIELNGKELAKAVVKKGQTTQVRKEYKLGYEEE